MQVRHNSILIRRPGGVAVRYSAGQSIPESDWDFVSDESKAELLISGAVVEVPDDSELPEEINEEELEVGLGDGQEADGQIMSSGSSGADGGMELIEDHPFLPEAKSQPRESKDAALEALLEAELNEESI